MFLESKIRIKALNVYYGQHHALQDINVDIPAQGITAIIGPSGCGKTTLLRCLNRLLEESDEVRVDGQVWLDGEDIYGRGIDVTAIRTQVGLLSPKPFPLPMSIYENVAFGRRIHKMGDRISRHNGRALDKVVERYLTVAGLWGEVYDRLDAPASRLSTGQQQRLCLARALAVEPDVLLCDEPTSALDPISAQRIEDQLKELRGETTIVVVTHLLRQAHRLADHVVFLWMGQLVEAGPADQIFNHPQDERTRAYIHGDIG
jgi:phosphate transport system ATP-binding protein